MILSVAHPNSTVLLPDGSIAEICEFHEEEDKFFVQVKKYSKKEPVFKIPCISGSLNIWEISRISKDSVRMSLENVQQKFIHFHLSFRAEDNVRSFVVPLLHTTN